MEKKQSDLCFEILRRFHRAGILNDLILIGSWCVYFYKDYFYSVPYLDQAAIKTRDIDFLIDKPSRIRKEVDVPGLLKDMGFLIAYKGSRGYIKLDHPDLILEFLVPERGRGENKPYDLKKLHVNAVTLRFLHFLSMNTIKVKIENFYMTLPHPANYALHKLIIHQRRTKEEKALKDKITAVAVLRALIQKGDLRPIRRAMKSIPKKWQDKIIDGLDQVIDMDILKVLKAGT